jgi:hypothetical protein
LPANFVHDKGRSRQQSQSPSQGGSNSVPTRLIRAVASEITDILEVVVAGKVRQTAIVREGGDSVLYHSLSRFVSNGGDYDNH